MIGEGRGGLEVRGVGVAFGGVHALTDVSMTVLPGRVHCIIGPNGSGKTTLLNAVSGFVPATGSVLLCGREILRTKPHRRVQYGLGRTFQNPRGDNTINVRDVMRLGEHLRHNQPWWMVALAPVLADRSWRESSQRAAAFLDRVGLDRSILDVPLADLPAGVLKLVDIGRALLGEPSVLLLDEPTSGMNENEIERLRDLLVELGGRDTTIVLVEHNLGFVSKTCEVVTVLANGRVLGHGSLDQVLEQDNVVEAYFGNAGASAYAHFEPVQNLSVNDRLDSDEPRLARATSPATTRHKLR